MEEINPDANQLQIATSETSKTPSNTSTDYRTKIGKLIIKSRLVCSLPALGVQELAAMVEAWAEVLMGVVPENRLDACYQWAMTHRDTTYPLGAPEIVRAWMAVAESERYRPVSAQLSHMLRGEVCSKCNGTGTQIITSEITKESSARVCSH